MAGEEAALGAVLFFGFIVLLCVAIGILATVFWIWMIIDCAKRKFPDDASKVIWILVIVLLSTLGAAIYYFVIKRPEDQHARPAKRSKK